MLANGDTKYPPWLEEEMAGELAVISDINICKYMGWTLTDLWEQPMREVAILTQYINVEQEAAKMRREKAEREAKSRGRRGRRGGRRRR